MSTEYALVFIKPDGVRRGLVGPIISRFEQRLLTITEMRMQVLQPDQIAHHYVEHQQKPFYPELEQYMLSGPVVLMVLKGYHAIQRIRQMVGATNPLEAEMGSIRGDFGAQTAENIIHASDSLESAKREREFFFPEG